MIVRDEQDVLERRLADVKDFVDEIIIVDTGSEDRTVEIARRYTRKIYHFKWCDDFSKARNYSVSKATSDWIIILDADEVVPIKSLRLIKKLIKNIKVDIYGVVIKNLQFSEGNLLNRGLNMLGLSKLCKDSYVFRLFKNLPDIRFRYRVHESISYDILHKYNFKFVPIEIYNIKRHSKKGSYLNLAKKELDEGMVNLDVFYDILEEAIQKRDWGNLNYFLDRVKTMPEYAVPYFVNFHYQLREHKKFSELIKFLKILISSTDKNAHFEFLLAKAYFALGAENKSKRIIRKLLQRYSHKKQLVDFVRARGWYSLL